MVVAVLGGTTAERVLWWERWMAAVTAVATTVAASATIPATVAAPTATVERMLV